MFRPAKIDNLSSSLSFSTENLLLVSAVGFLSRFKKRSQKINGQSDYAVLQKLGEAMMLVNVSRHWLFEKICYFKYRHKVNVHFSELKPILN